VRWVIFATALLVFPFTSAGADEKVPATLVLQWQPQAQFAGYYMAQTKGFYRDAGVELRIIPSGPDAEVSRQLITNQGQFATLFLATGIERRAEGVPLVNLAQIVQRSALMLVTRAGLGIREPKDLDGKRVGLWNNEFQLQPKALFQRLRIQPRIVPQSTTLNLFLRGGVDAASAMWYNEYHTLLASGLDPDDLQVFFFRDLDLNFPEDGIYTMEKTLATAPDLCRSVVAASLRGWEYAFAHPEETVDLVMARMREAHLPSNRPHQRFMLARMRDIILGQEGDQVPPLGQLSQSDFDRVADTVLSQGLIRAKPDFKDFFRGAAR
jgi:NitT/TauT family transport system substrate-binding protein